MKEILLSQNKVALVDNDDFEWLSQWKWCTAKDRHTFYAVRSVQKNYEVKRLWMHREILQTPFGSFTDHINGDGLDNRRCNLRVATISQNGANRRVNRNSKLGFKGVSWHKRHGRWIAHIGVNGKLIHLGYFNDLHLAQHAYTEASKHYFGEFAR